MSAASGRRSASSGSPFEATIGFSRAVRVGDRIIASGTAPVEADGTSTSGDVGAQASRCLAIILGAIEELGGSASDVVRTRMYLADAADAEAIGAAHGGVRRHPPRIDDGSRGGAPPPRVAR